MNETSSRPGIEAVDESRLPAEAVPDADLALRDERVTGRQRWTIRLAVVALILVVILAAVWLSRRPGSVAVVRPVEATITEAISGSGVVGGETESNVGTQTPGVVRELYVEEGAEVVRRQRLGLIENRVATAQIAQARAALESARSQLALASRGALGSDVRAAEQQVNQAMAQAEQQRAAVSQAERNVEQAESVLEQLISEQQLAEKELTRSRALFETGDVPRSDYDRVLNASQVAEKRVEAQRRSIEAARAGLLASRSNLKSLQAGVAVQRERLQTIRSGARPEDVRLAEARVTEASRALAVAESQADNTLVTAPFAGRVTKINTEPGQTVGSLGILTLVSSLPEIRLDVDESNLPSLSVGQEARISIDGREDKTFGGHISELGAAVDEIRGTITVRVSLDNPPEWLRPGQTVNVSIITAQNVNRLLVPQSSIVRIGDDTVVFVIEDGIAVKRKVTANNPTSDGVPIVTGLQSEDLVITNPESINDGDRVLAK